MIAIAHSLSEGNMLCDTRVEVLLLGRGKGCDREFSGAACASMHRSIRRYSGKESTDLNQYLDGKKWKCQKLRRDLLILRSVIPQSGVECVCSYVRSFTFDCRGSKNRSTGVWISQKYFTAHSTNQDGNVSAWSLRSPPVPTQETPLDFSWAHMSIDPEANFRLKETRDLGRVCKGEFIPSYDNRRMSLGWFGRPDVITFEEDDDVWVRVIPSNVRAYVYKILSR